MILNLVHKTTLRLPLETPGRSLYPPVVATPHGGNTL